MRSLEVLCLCSCYGLLVFSCGDLPYVVFISLVWMFACCVGIVGVVLLIL